ncbi:hypothetical protein JTE90_022666 [Oedothorax gibbosus]|uniref:cholesterol 7-desaturase n=1 Tax=Oedothorax gibbosus TaxID=931172 RepID=A0AAV6UKE3_9ARAC|nr:hypothetical protein JTE90_022666 [Oedothorax gibbosus]
MSHCTSGNNSRCPKTLLDWLASDVTSEQSPLGASADGPQTTMSFSRVVGAAIVCFVVCNAFYKWLHRHKLRYLLRLSLATSILSLSLHILCHLQTTYDTTFCSSIRDHLSWTTPISLLFVLVMVIVRYHWAVPYNITKSQLSVGFSHLEAPAKKRLKKVKDMARERLMSGYPGQLPPVYPNGWIPIVESNEVKTGEVVSVTAIGQKFCVFRGELGSAYVLDAYCPHLGADLSAGGTVKGECVECPFHGWQFGGKDGTCHKIPYSDKVPDIARAKTWPSRDVNGFIFVWHHAEDEEPSWEMPAIPEVQSGQWRFRGKTAHEVHCHIQEIPENGADVAHLHQVHSNSVFLGQRWMDAGGHWMDFLLNALQHDWLPQWEADTSRSHVGRIRLSQRMRIFGVELPLSKLQLNIEQIGPACVHLHVDWWFGRGVLLQHITPEGPLTQRVVHLLYTEPGFRQFPADLFVLGESIMLERDIAVWNNKMFLRTPVLVREDKLIARYRRWYSQFYSQNSPTLQSERERTLDW